MTFAITLDREKRDGTCLVLLQVLHHQSIKRKNLGFAVRKEHFAQGEVKKADPLHKEKNRKILSTLNDAQRIHLQFPRLTAKQVVERIGGGQVPHDFYSQAKASIEARLQSKDIGYGTYKHRLSILEMVNGIRPHMLLDELNTEALLWIKTTMYQRGNTENTVTGKIRKLRTIWMDACRDKGIELPSPWRNIKGRTNSVEARGLLPEEFARVVKVDLSMDTPRVRLARDCFVLQWHFAGMRWQDLCRTTTDMLRDDGKLHYRMKKSRKPIVYPVHDDARAILAGYKGEGSYCLPLLKTIDPDEKTFLREVALANNRINKWLKVVAARAGLVSLSTHMARHTYAIKVVLSGGTTYELKDVMGHSSLKETEGYIEKLTGSHGQSVFDKIHGKG